MNSTEVTNFNKTNILLVSSIIIFFLLIDMYILFLFHADISMKISFIISSLSIELGFFKYVNREIGVEFIMHVFGIYFFVLAPLIQINSGKFPNLIDISSENIIYVNLIISIWYFLFNYIPSIKIGNKKSNYIKKNGHVEPGTRMLFFLATIIFFLLYFGKYGLTLFYGSIQEEVQIQAIKSLQESVVTNIVFFNFILQYENIKNKNTLGTKVSLLLSSVVVIYFISPFNRSRFFLAYVLIFFILKFYSKKITPLLFFMLLSVGLLVIFPILDIFRNGFTDINLDVIIEKVTTQFNKLHFDSYASFIVDIESVKNDGLKYGLTLVSALFFFIPQAIINWKIGGGYFVGTYLIQNTWFGSVTNNFTNVSNPILGEIYLNFGFLGIIISAFIIKFILNNFFEFGEMKYILCGFIFFIFRGDFLASLSNMMSSIVVIILLPKLLNYLFRLK